MERLKEFPENFMNLVTGPEYETILAIKCKRIMGDKLGEKYRGDNWERKWARKWERKLERRLKRKWERVWERFTN